MASQDPVSKSCHIAQRLTEESRVEVIKGAVFTESQHSKIAEMISLGIAIAAQCESSREEEIKNLINCTLAEVHKLECEYRHMSKALDILYTWEKHQTQDIEILKNQICQIECRQHNMLKTLEAHIAKLRVDDAALQSELRKLANHMSALSVKTDTLVAHDLQQDKEIKALECQVCRLSKEIKTHESLAASTLECLAKEVRGLEAALNSAKARNAEIDMGQQEEIKYLAQEVKTLKHREIIDRRVDHLIEKVEILAARKMIDTRVDYILEELECLKTREARIDRAQESQIRALEKRVEVLSARELIDPRVAVLQKELNCLAAKSSKNDAYQQAEIKRLETLIPPVVVTRVDLMALEKEIQDLKTRQARIDTHQEVDIDELEKMVCGLYRKIEALEARENRVDGGQEVQIQSLQAEVHQLMIREHFDPAMILALEKEIAQLRAEGGIVNSHQSREMASLYREIKALAAREMKDTRVDDLQDRLKSLESDKIDLLQQEEIDRLKMEECYQRRLYLKMEQQIRDQGIVIGQQMGTISMLETSIKGLEKTIHCLEDSLKSLEVRRECQIQRLKKENTCLNQGLETNYQIDSRQEAQIQVLKERLDNMTC